MNSKIAYSLALFLTVPCLFSCSLVDNADAPSCIDRLDCAPNQTCQDGFCQPLPKPESVVDFELTPLRGTGAAVTQIAGQDLARVPDILDVELEVEAAVAVNVEIRSPYVMGGIPGTLVASRDPDIDSRRLVWNTEVGESGVVEPELAPGIYNMLFKPANRAEFPQIELQGYEVPSEFPPPLQMPRYPPAEDLLAQPVLLLVHGQVLHNQEYPHPVTGIKVEGITEHALRTSLSVPDEEGHFYLRLPLRMTADAEGKPLIEHPEFLDLVIRPESNVANLPTVTVEDVELDNPELGVFYVGVLPAMHSVSGAVVDFAGQPVPECHLRFEAEEIGNGTYTRQIQADDKGLFSSNLPEGSYRVTAIPDLLAEERITTKIIDLVADLSDVSIFLADRSVLEGVIHDSDGKRVPDVIIRAKRTWNLAFEEDGLARTYEGVSNAQGLYALPLDAGIYIITYIPPATSGLARLPLPKRIYMVDANVTLDVTLPAPVVVQGNVFNPLGEPMCGVTIDVYNSDDDEAYLIGQAISGGDGSDCTGAYTLTIPANLIPPD